MVKRLGGSLVGSLKDASSATYVIAASDDSSLRRTPKLMIGLCKTSNIVHLNWLLRSAKERKVLPSKDFLLVDNEAFEKQYNFNMRETLTRSEIMRVSGKSLLGGYSVFVCSGVAGNKAKGNRTPPIDEFRLILEAAGAKMLTTMPSATKKNVDFSKVMVLVSKVASEAKKQSSTKLVAAAIKKGAISKSTEELFHSIMTQQL